LLKVNQITKLATNSVSGKLGRNGVEIGLNGSNEISRMRFGLMNDALCEIYWVGPKKHNIGMGYICEGDVESERFVQNF